MTALSNLEIYYGDDVVKCPDLKNKICIVFDPRISSGFTGQGRGKNISVSTSGTNHDLFLVLSAFGYGGQVNIWRRALPDEIAAQLKTVPKEALDKTSKAVIDQSAIIKAGNTETVHKQIENTYRAMLDAFRQMSATATIPAASGAGKKPPTKA